MYSSMHQGRLLSSLARPCRFVARRRYPAVTSPVRRFHLSQTWRSSIPTDPNDSRNPSSDGKSSENSALNGNHNTGESESAAETSAERLSARDLGPYGSALRRALRSKRRLRPPAVPSVELPKWFYEINMRLPENASAQKTQFKAAIRVAAEREQESSSEMSSGNNSEGSPAADEQSLSDSRYALTNAMREELFAAAKAGLRLPPTRYAKDPTARKSHLVLQYPGANGTRFLDAVVQQLSRELNAALVTLDAQDIAQLCIEQDLADTGHASPIRLLGYEVFRSQFDPSKEAGSGVNEEDEGEADPIITPSLHSLGVGRPKFITIESSREPGDIPLPGLSGLKTLVAAINPPDGSNSAVSQLSSDRSRERRAQLVQKVLSCTSEYTEQSVAQLSADNELLNKPSEARSEQTRDLIVQVQDYNEIQNTREGSLFLSLLQSLIQERRENGHRVLFIGTASQELPPGSTSARLMQDSYDDQFSQMVVVTPAMAPQAIEKTFEEDRRAHTLLVNCRHLQIMLQTRLGDEYQATDPAELVDNIMRPMFNLERHLLKKSGITDQYWSYGQVHRAVTLALGSLNEDERCGLEHIAHGINKLVETDHVRDEWLQGQTTKTKSTGTKNDHVSLISSLIKTCNKYEKKLLSGVVNAKNIRTAFSDVHVPPETIDALKTLTSLSLVRPEAFKYGVLASDKIPGLLLYGPPGTGKTLLAKAVARESGATVLEVSGSEIYDKYVGEGEKNVKAIFTLAKKLNPCVVFIDEADAIFSSRTGGSKRSSHRELVNQFLREWDGMNDLSTFIMVATNRPFDLDDAVLRRLPRRLLVDLPTEQDRLSILKIHLKEETLDSSVDLADLARQTPLYSGSDLKNLCVAAALACVREENALAQQHVGDEPYQYPTRRTLTWAHFTRGIEEISASISEDMSSLSAIRKFDERYGDRKGRRKKNPGWGFNAPISEEAASDAARVRS